MEVAEGPVEGGPPLENEIEVSVAAQSLAAAQMLTGY